MSINLDDFLGKIDDMLYRPVDAVCKFIEEPLNFSSTAVTSKPWTELPKLKQTKDSRRRN